MSNEQILDEAERLYEEYGPSAVYDYALTLSGVRYDTCHPCETNEAPTIDGTCMLCGALLSTTK